MAYATYAITAMTEIPALVKTFADARGWTTTTVSATSVTVRHPTYTGAKTFGVQTDHTGSGITLLERLRLTCTDASNSALVISPKLNVSQADIDSAVQVIAPSRLHLFGELGGNSASSGVSFIAGVIEYGANLYRHFYLGYADKISAYEGGELITGSACWFQTQGITGVVTRPFFDVDHCIYPFSALHQAGYVDNGGMHINHVGNAQPWREFANRQNLVATTLFANFSTNGHKVVLGGYKDSINSGYMLAGKSPYSGAQIMTPINLYIGKRSASEQNFQAVGNPAGVRLVHMEDLEPGAEVTVGSSVWRVFPVFSKRSEANMTAASTLATAREWPAFNSSQYVGMAYRVSA